MADMELEKVKIDLLRDSLRDVVDTIRALDKKIRYIISFNAVALGFIGSILLLYKQELKIDIFSSLSIFGFLLLVPWVANLIGLLWTFDPKVNPNNIFCAEKDKKAFDKCYFIPFQFNFFNWNPKNHIHLSDLVENYNSSIQNYDDVKSMLYKEISKLSFIRDIKVKNIKISLKTTILLTFISFFLLFYFAYLGNLAVNSHTDTNATVAVAVSEDKNSTKIQTESNKSEEPIKNPRAAF